MSIEIISNIVFPSESEPNSPELIGAALANCGKGNGFILKVALGESCTPLIARVRRIASKNGSSVAFHFEGAKGELYVRDCGPIKRRANSANSAQQDLTLNQGAN